MWNLGLNLLKYAPRAFAGVRSILGDPVKSSGLITGGILGGKATNDTINSGILGDTNLMEEGMNFFSSPAISFIKETPSGEVYNPDQEQIDAENEFNKDLNTKITTATNNNKANILITPEVEKPSSLLSTPESNPIDFSNQTFPEQTDPDSYILTAEEQPTQTGLLLDRPSLTGIVDQGENKKPSSLLNIYEVTPDTSGQGWEPLEIMRIVDDQPVYKQIAYAFNNPPEDYTGTKEDYFNDMVNAVIRETKIIFERASKGDKEADAILNQLKWYDSEVSSGRETFGGIYDLVADILGTTSAQTNVRDNWRNATEVVENYTKGKYDNIINKYNQILEKQEITPTEYAKLHYDLKKKKGDEYAQSEYPMLRKINPDGTFGALFNANSPATMLALMDQFRQLRVGGSPKTIQYTENLAGSGNQSIIDIWMARFLRRLSGRDRIPPAGEKAVSGKVLVDGETIGGEYGYGQKVFNEAVKKLNEMGIDVDAKQLQALNWFAEKELWAKNGWSPSSGGSIEFERMFYGLPKETQVKVNELRSIIDSRNSTAEDKYHAISELDELYLRAGTDRYNVGISATRPLLDQIPEQALDIKQSFINIFKDDETVKAVKGVPTIGKYMGEGELSLDVEIVATKDFDKNKLITNAVENAKKYDQDSTFISQIVSPDNYLTHPNAENLRPGMEVYFGKKFSEEQVDEIINELNKQGFPGFTFVKDTRVQDNVNPVLGFTGREEYVGIRTQYIPEYDGYENYNDLPKEEKDKLFNKQIDKYINLKKYLMENYKDLSFAGIFFHDTLIINREKYDEFLR